MLKLVENITVICFLIISILCCYTSLKYRTKYLELNHLFLYSLASLSQTILTKALAVLSGTISTQRVNIYTNISIHIFILIEFSSIYFFFYKNNVFTKLVKKTLSLICIVFISFYIVTLNSTFFSPNMGHLYYTESLVILIPCFIYLYQLFLKPPTLDLLQEPAFWFTSGILIYFVLTLPLFLIIDNLQQKHLGYLVNTINCFGYIIIFSFLIKAFRCKPKILI